MPAMANKQSVAVQEILYMGGWGWGAMQGNTLAATRQGKWGSAVSYRSLRVIIIIMRLRNVVCLCKILICDNAELKQQAICYV